MNVLVTGGAGFIGSSLARRLIREGCRVTILDNFSPQVHGGSRDLPPDLVHDVRLVVGDVRDENAVARALRDQEVVVHLAAETGTGQSMYEVARYEDVNVHGTAVLIECLVKCRPKSLERIVLASSRAVYGEGQYQCKTHGQVFPEARELDAMKDGRFEPLCPHCRSAVTAVPTREDCPLRPSSFYGLTKQMQEQMILLFAEALGISTLVLRYQNVYGPGQSLRNPYTGILAIFTNLAKENLPIKVFEDGLESRDFVYIDDVVDATWRAISDEAPRVEILNVGSGDRVTILEVVQAVLQFFSSSSPVSVTGAFRQGDVRHSLADIERIRNVLKYEPRLKFSQGVTHFLAWVASQSPRAAGYEESLQEMRNRGFYHG
jgi:dTDP-L-rhamnose 4-epimerase